MLLEEKTLKCILWINITTMETPQILNFRIGLHDKKKSFILNDCGSASWNSLKKLKKDNPDFGIYEFFNENTRVKPYFDIDKYVGDKKLNVDDIKNFVDRHIIDALTEKFPSLSYSVCGCQRKSIDKINK
jgi:hypothetical protein